MVTVSHVDGRVRSEACPVSLPCEEVDMPVGAVLGIMTLRGRVEEVAQARSFVGRSLRGHPARDTAVLLTSEFVTNAIIHGAAGVITVMLIGLPGGIRVEVSDGGSASVPRLRPPTTTSENGRGLVLVDRLAARWDHVRDEAGLTAWFELDAEAAEPPGDGHLSDTA